MYSSNQNYLILKNDDKLFWTIFNIWGILWWNGALLVISRLVDISNNFKRFENPLTIMLTNFVASNFILMQMVVSIINIKLHAKRNENENNELKRKRQRGKNLR